MPDYSDDSDEEIGAYIYSTSRTAKLLREEAAARNNELPTNNDNNIYAKRSKRKSPHEFENDTYISFVRRTKGTCEKEEKDLYLYLQP